VGNCCEGSNPSYSAIIKIKSIKDFLLYNKKVIYMFKEELSLVPHLPGCYLMKNKDNIVIYVGKSKNLKNRLSSYFQREHTGKTMMLVREIDHFEYIVTNTEMESLLLEIILSIIYYIEMINHIHI
jgi:hypothetical protein